MTVGQALGEAVRRLSGAGIESAGREARLLLGHVAGLAPATLIGWPETELPAPALAAFDAAVERRCRREPVSRILGRREFWSLDLALGPATLDPRPDSETLVEAALALLPDRDGSRRVLDLGTGSGCLLLALLGEWPNAVGLGLDRAEAAVRTARDNARALGLDGRARFVVGDWTQALGEAGFDLVVANPPYVETAAIDRLEPEVRLHDPRAALDGGPDGLGCYRAILGDLGRILVPGGLVVLELGQGQAGSVAELVRAGGLEPVGLRHDLAGIERAFIGRSRGGRK
jgi:release factor glutamine methyltransferase